MGAISLQVVWCDSASMGCVARPAAGGTCTGLSYGPQVTALCKVAPMHPPTASWHDVLAGDWFLQ